MTVKRIVSREAGCLGHRVWRAVVRGLEFISATIGCHWRVLHRGVVCSDLC